MPFDFCAGEVNVQNKELNTVSREYSDHPMNFHNVWYQNGCYEESITLTAILHIPSPVILIVLQ